MFYVSCAGGVEQPRVRRKLEDDDVTDLASLRERLEQNWPSDICDAHDALHLPLPLLRSMAAEHNKPHAECGFELWRVCGFFGKRRRYAVAACFTFRAVVDECALPDADAALPLLASVVWTVTDHACAKQYRFSYVDARFAVMFAALLAQGAVAAEPHVLQAMAEHVRTSGGAAPVQPDQLLPAGSVSMRVATLDVQCGGCTLRFDSPTGVSPGHGQHGVYVLHLEGQTRDVSGSDADARAQSADDGVCVRAVVDLVLHPGVGPFLDGQRGVVTRVCACVRSAGCSSCAAATDSLGNAFDPDAVFAYTYPFARLRSGSLCITRADDALELLRERSMREGTAWVQHCFGAVVPRTRDEVAALRAWRRRQQCCNSSAVGGDNNAESAAALLHTVDARHGACGTAQTHDASAARCVSAAAATVPACLSPSPSYDIFWLRLYDSCQHTVTVFCQYDDGHSCSSGNGSNGSSEATQRRVCRVYAIVHSGEHKRARYYDKYNTDGESCASVAVDVEERANKQHRSHTTGLLYPTEWQLRVPLYSGGSGTGDGSVDDVSTHNADDADRPGAVAALTVRMRFAQQEVTTTLAQPAVWHGSVAVEGSVALPPPPLSQTSSNAKTSEASDDTTDATTRAAASSTTTVVQTVTGEGFVQCYRGSTHARDVAGLFDVLRRVTTATLERDEACAVSAVDEAASKAAVVAEAPAVLSCLSTVSALASLQDVVLPDAYKLVLAALLGTYAYLYHYPCANSSRTSANTVDDASAVCTAGDDAAARHAAVSLALQFCHGKWLEYFGSGSRVRCHAASVAATSASLDYRALVLRAFMLRELHRVLCTRHADFVAAALPCNGATAAAPPATTTTTTTTATSTRAAETLPHTALDVVTLCTSYAHTQAAHNNSSKKTNSNDEEDERRVSFVLPGPSAPLSSPPRGVDVAQLKALLDGTWRVHASDAHDHADACDRIALAKGMSWAWRNYRRHALPALECRVHSSDNNSNSNSNNNGDNKNGNGATASAAEASAVFVDVVEVAALSRTLRRVHLHGQAWQWPWPAWCRDNNGNNNTGEAVVATSRACVLDGGHQLFVETTLPRGNSSTCHRRSCPRDGDDDGAGVVIERMWFAFAQGGTTLLLHVQLFACRPPPLSSRDGVDTEHTGDDDAAMRVAAVAPCVSFTLRYRLDTSASLPVRDVAVTQMTA